MPTTNPVPSTDPSDLLFNAGRLDEVVNGTANSFTDRLGVQRRTVAGMNADFDAQLADAESDLNVYRADAASSAAEALGYLQTIRATSYGAYASDPATDPLGNPPTVGDEYFNTTSNLLKRWNGTTWQASDINTANLAASSGSSLVGYDGGTVQDVLDGAKSLQDYAALRAYTGSAKRIYITGSLVTAKPAGISGFFQYDTTDATSADNGGTIIVGADGRRWKRDCGGDISLQWFEAHVGSADNTAAIQAAVNASGGKTLSGDGLTYKISGAITCQTENLIIKDMTLDCSTMGNLPSPVDYIITIAGTQGGPVSLTSDCLAGTAVVSVGSTASFSADGYVWLQCNTLFETETNTKISQLAKVKSIDSATQITLFTDILFDFTMAASATIAPIAAKSNIAFKNCTFIGSNLNTQCILNFDRCVDVTVEDCRFFSFDYTCIRFYRCVNPVANKCKFRDAQGAGLSYGVSIEGGSYAARVTQCYGEDLRHMVTVGDNSGVNLFVVVSENSALGCRDAAIDSHPACQYMEIIGNTIECVASATFPTPRDGIIFQGNEVIISNNTIVGSYVRGIAIEVYGAIGKYSAVISGNTLKNAGLTASTSRGIYIINKSSEAGSVIRGLSIYGNIIDASLHQAIYIHANLGSIADISICANDVLSGAAESSIYFDADAGFTIDGFSINGNLLSSIATNNVMFIGTGAPNILNGAISGNIIKGGTNGIRYIYASNITESGNLNSAPNKNLIDTGSINIDLDRRQSTIRTITNSAATVSDQDKFIICNRAGTVTLVLPSAETHTGRELVVKTIQAQAVISSMSNVVPVADSVAGTVILPATDGAWVTLKSSGTNWIAVQGSL